MQSDADLLTSLHGRVHFVLCDGKVAKHRDWQKTAPDLGRVLEHHKRGGAVGFIPGKSELWVLDVDSTGDPVAIREGLGDRGSQALTTVQTKRGAHVYFKKNGGGQVRNRQWALNGLHGDVRGDRGYCVAWNLGQLSGALDGLAAAVPTSDGVFPRPAKAAAGAAASRRAQHRSKRLGLPQGSSGADRFCRGTRHGHSVGAGRGRGRRHDQECKRSGGGSNLPTQGRGRA